VKIRYKIMLLFTLLVTAIISLLTGSVFYFARLERVQVFNRRLKSRASYNTQLYALMGDSAFTFLRRMDTTGGVLPRRSMGIYTDDGKTLYQYDVPGAPALFVNNDLLREVKEKGEKYFSIGDREAVAIHRETRNRDFIVVVAGRDDDGLERVQTLNKILLFSLVVGVFLTALVSYLFTGQLLRPLSQIIREVKDISSYDLSHRIRAGAGQDELSQLANTFNDLLSRLQESFAIQRRFISNASHELSTPLTSVSSQVEVALQKERNADEYKQVLHSIKEDVQQMRQLTKSLLEIAKTGSQGGIEVGGEEGDAATEPPHTRNARAKCVIDAIKLPHCPKRHIDPEFAQRDCGIARQRAVLRFLCCAKAAEKRRNPRGRQRPAVHVHLALPKNLGAD